ncbi:MAG: PD-(D/E)XK nuclease family protein, partial [Chloroflexota bacterium]
GGWMRALREAYDAMPLGARSAIEVREPAAVDLEAVTRRQPPRVIAVPDEADEVEFAPPLVDRPPLIPLRASTPVTALRPREEETTTFAYGDGLAQLRGVLAHRAIELTYTRGARPDLLTELASIDEGALDAESRTRVASEVATVLDAFDASDLATTLRDSETDAWFEFPFAWDWDGVPVHGTLDLLYRRDGAYHIVDFKTDDLRGRTAATVAQDYLAQLGLYAGAVERATGALPPTALYFLRTGERYAPAREDIEAALARTREEIDAGLLRAIAPDPFEDPD